jgi:hypothetical protein
MEKRPGKGVLPEQTKTMRGYFARSYAQRQGKLLRANSC